MTHLKLAHSPDPDDAFMWWPLVGLDGSGPCIDTGGYTFELVAEDIQALNEISAEARYDITAMSCAQYARVADRYALTACGASMGDGYGPKLVSADPARAEDLAQPDTVIAVPGMHTSAFGALSLLLGPGNFTPLHLPFDEIIDAVAADLDRRRWHHSFEAGFEDASALA